MKDIMKSHLEAFKENFRIQQVQHMDEYERKKKMYQEELQHELAQNESNGASQRLRASLNSQVSLLCLCVPSFVK
jgi:hypothetical protein